MLSSASLGGHQRRLRPARTADPGFHRQHEISDSSGLRGDNPSPMDGGGVYDEGKQTKSGVKKIDKRRN